MMDIIQMSPEQLAALVCQTLQNAGIVVTLTGGTCVSIWSSGKYVSHDLDFIEEGPVLRRPLVEAMRTLGFEPQGRHFIRQDCRYLVEFPTGPLMVGDQRVERVSVRRTDVGELRLLTPTDCVKDRLAAFFHWNDRQSLEQAVLVASAQAVDLHDVRKWSEAEGCLSKFELFASRLRR